jgi:phenylacetic acid degradation operon negative regulatory protein
MLHVMSDMDKSRNATAGSDADSDGGTEAGSGAADPGPRARLVERVAALDLRPLSARSVVLSALLGTHPPVMPVAALVALAERFGVSSGTLRTALSRMVANDELTTSDGRYELTGRLLDRQREQDVGRRRPVTDWDGSWWVASALSTRRSAAERRRFRSAMEGAKLRELRPDTWMRPANLPVTVDLPGVIVSRGDVSRSTSVQLVDQLWDVPATEERARGLTGALDLVDEALGTTGGGDAAGGEDAAGGGATDVIAPAFTVLAACLRFLRVEPQLPEELAATPASDRLRRRYADTERAVQAQLRAVYRAALREIDPR